MHKRGCLLPTITHVKPYLIFITCIQTSGVDSDLDGNNLAVLRSPSDVSIGLLRCASAAPAFRVICCGADCGSEGFVLAAPSPLITAVFNPS